MVLFGYSTAKHAVSSIHHSDIGKQHRLSLPCCGHPACTAVPAVKTMSELVPGFGEDDHQLSVWGQVFRM